MNFISTLLFTFLTISSHADDQKEKKLVNITRDLQTSQQIIYDEPKDRDRVLDIVRERDSGPGNFEPSGKPPYTLMRGYQSPGLQRAFIENRAVTETGVKTGLFLYDTDKSNPPKLVSAFEFDGRLKSWSANDKSWFFVAENSIKGEFRDKTENILYTVDVSNANGRLVEKVDLHSEDLDAKTFGFFPDSIDLNRDVYLLMKFPFGHIFVIQFDEAGKIIRKSSAGVREEIEDFSATRVRDGKLLVKTKIVRVVIVEEEVIPTPIKEKD